MVFALFISTADAALTTTGYADRKIGIDTAETTATLGGGGDFQQFDGDTYYNTGLIGNLDTEIEVVMSMKKTTEQQKLFGAHTSYNRNGISMYAYAGDYLAPQVTFGATYKTQLPRIDDNTIKRIKFNKSGYYVNNELVWASTQTAKFSTPARILLGNIGTTSQTATTLFQGKVYSLIIKQNGNIVANWKPVATGFYDSVSGTIKTPVAGTANFGNDAAGVAKYVADDAGGKKLVSETLSPVAFSGSYNDLTDTPNIPVVPQKMTIDELLTGTSTEPRTIDAKTLNLAVGPVATMTCVSNACSASVPGFKPINGMRFLVRNNIIGNIAFFIPPTLTIDDGDSSTTDTARNFLYNDAVFYSNTKNDVFEIVYYNNKYYLLGLFGIGTSQTKYNIRNIENLSWSYNGATLLTRIMRQSMMTFMGEIATLAGTSSAYTFTETDTYNENYDASVIYKHQRIIGKIPTTNAAGATLKINSQTAKPIYLNGAAITAGKLVEGGVYEFIYDGTNWNVLTAPASDTIPIPGTDCDNATKKCVLTYGYTNGTDATGGLSYVWEVIER
ncbi:MAG: hypothetical protein LBL75_02905 [Rickettsiales bacterium]|nr:hypothetical protein [Rickettsiales bacterium]